jgi:uncharacterized protein
MPKNFQSRQIELVIKITKYCNLRCSYCYEYPHLGDKARISLDNLEKLFRHVSALDLGDGPADPDADMFSFIWHGGEPFMVRLAYYDAIGALQDAVIDDRVTYHNSVQTNLTVLTDAHIEHIEEKRFFHEVGFSFDVYGDQRVDALGRASTARVLKNLQRVRDHGIAIGAIAVLSRATFPCIKNIYRFYESMGIGFRILPYHLEAFEQQTAMNGLPPTEIAAAMCDVFDLWLQSESPVTVYPLETYIDNAIAYMNGKRNVYYSKEANESIFIVDTDGSISGYETYLSEHRYGNIFEQTFEEILDSQNRRRLASLADARVERHCGACKYYGACSGFPVAEASPMEEAWLRESGCYVATIIGHIVERLEWTGLGAPRLAALDHAPAGAAAE